MVDEVKLHPAVKTPDGWQFRVDVHRQPHLVSVSEQYYRKLTHSKVSPMELTLIAVEVVLSERSPQALTEEVSLEQLAELIPDFEKRVRGRVRSTAATNPI
ncbi:MAG: hypothetical protein HY975_00215 [Candidatus Kerfeldbacteria bacterium]|nr:hypothetical protein [Candidatus Kerfeldbacteria bacterium]